MKLPACHRSGCLPRKVRVFAISRIGSATRGEIPGRDTVLEKRTPVAERRQESAAQPVGSSQIAADSWKETGPGARPRKAADVTQVAVEAGYCRLGETKGKLDIDERRQLLPPYAAVRSGQ